MKVLVILGPTGVGKSELSLELAKKYNGEIISGDSIQIYKELNIGSAKVSLEDREEIPHYLVDRFNVDESYDVSMFQTEARALIEDITSRGKLPIIVGGTGLYINAVLKNYIFLEEEEDLELKASLDAMTNEELYEELYKLDKEAALNLHVNNRPRLLRALTIIKTQNVSKTDLVSKQDNTLLYDALIISLTMERQELYSRINERVLQMIDDGLEEEVKGIVDQYENPFELRGMFGIGYKEWKPYFENEVDKDSVILEIQKKSRNYAKRQYTWFNNQFDATWFDVSQSNYKTKINEAVLQWLDKEDKDV